MTKPIGIFLSLWVILTITCVGPLLGQTTALQTKATLPALVFETSGLLCSGPDTIYTHNDSQNSSVIYHLNAFGQLQRSITITNASNIDWEDLAREPNGRFFVGDFGNNANTRQNLRILVLPNLDTLNADTLSAGFINFSYPQQTHYPPPNQQLHYDAEGFVFKNDSLFIFTKNRTNPFDGFVRLYALPATPGTYQAALRDSFYLGPGPMEDYWVTAADLSPNGKQLFLLSYNRFWLFSCFEGSDFFGGHVRTETFNQASKKEGVAYINNQQAFVTDEGFLFLQPKLYVHHLYNWGKYPHPWLADTLHLSQTNATLHATPGLHNYLWDNQHTDSVRAINQSGSYHLTQTAHNGCTTTDTVFVNYLISANQPTQINTNQPKVINLPNQRINLWAGPNISRIEIINLKGQLVTGISHPQPNTQVAISQRGVYLARFVYHNGAERVKRFIIQ